MQVAILAALLAAFFVRFPQVSGRSMAPQIDSGERVVIDTLAYRFGAPQRGDIIAFRHDGNPPEIFIKRVIGLPGDRIRIRQGIVYVNGQRLFEPYVRYRDDRSLPSITVPPGMLYVLGDNRVVSEDSRMFGPVPERDVIGKAVAALWPADRLGAL